MKDIMTDLSMTETRVDAHEKWREYVSAEKIYRKPEYTDMKKVYNQIKQGRKVIDIFKVIERGGVRTETGHPVLAIAQVKSKKVYCCYEKGGRVYFVNRSTRWSSTTMSPIKVDVDLPQCLPAYSSEKYGMSSWGNFHLSAPVPHVPPKFLPANIKDTHYILWEVDQWTNDPPTDPWLLERITKNLFVVLAGWDLTDIEKSVMRGRLL